LYFRQPATEVHVAVKVRATDIISQLKDFGCDIDKFSTDGVNAIYLACKTAAEDKTVTPVISLMQLGAKIDRVDPVFFRTALHKACDEELPEICRFLVLSKASVLVQDKLGDTPLHIVAKRGSTRTLEVICQALVGGEKIVHNPDREKEDLEMKLEAISDQADEAKIRSIMSIPDSAGNTPLHIACSFGYEQLVNLLLRKGGDPEKKNHPSRKGVDNSGGGQVRPDKKSKRKKQSQDDDSEAKPVGSQGGGGKTPYHVCAEVGHTDLFKTFVRKGIDTSGIDEFGHTCLHYAAMNNDVEIAEIQMECDPNPNVQNLAGWTPLHYAAAYDSVHIIVLLVEFFKSHLATQFTIQCDSKADFCENPPVRGQRRPSIRKQPRPHAHGVGVTNSYQARFGRASQRDSQKGGTRKRAERTSHDGRTQTTHGRNGE